MFSFEIDVTLFGATKRKDSHSVFSRLSPASKQKTTRTTSALPTSARSKRLSSFEQEGSILLSLSLSRPQRLTLRVQREREERDEKFSTQQRQPFPPTPFFLRHRLLFFNPFPPGEDERRRSRKRTNWLRSFCRLLTESYCSLAFRSIRFAPGLFCD